MHRPTNRPCIECGDYFTTDEKMIEVIRRGSFGVIHTECQLVNDVVEQEWEPLGWSQTEIEDWQRQSATRSAQLRAEQMEKRYDNRALIFGLVLLIPIITALVIAGAPR